MGVLAVFYIRVFYNLRDRFARLVIHPQLKPVLGALLVGLIAGYFPQVLGDGYWYIEDILAGQYIIRNPFAVSKITYNPASGMVIYKSKPTQRRSKGGRRNFQVFSATEFIAAITQHIPEKSFQLVRYYGWYSNRGRGSFAAQWRKMRASSEIWPFWGFFSLTCPSKAVTDKSIGF